MARATLIAFVLVTILVAPALAQWDETAAPLTATPSVLGPSGCIITPTTDVGNRSYSLGYHWLNNTFDAAAKLNVAPIEQLEIGVTYIEPADPTLDGEAVFNAKYLIAEEDGDSPAFAVGVWDMSDELDQTWYGVVSKRIDGEVPITINIGGGSGDVLDGVFASVGLQLTEDVDFLVEYDSEEINFGLRARPYEGLTIDLISVDNGVDREFGVGAAYSAAW